MYITSRFWDRFAKSDATTQGRLLREIRAVVKRQTSVKNRNYLTMGKIGQASKELGISLRKERLSLSGRIIFHKDSEGNHHLVDFDWEHSSVGDLESNSVSTLKKVLINETFRPEIENWVNAQGEKWRLGLQFPSDGNRDTFAEELGDEWIRFLDKEQQHVCDQLFSELSQGDEAGVYLILGAAGTGKTMVLLELAWRLIHDAGINVHLQLPTGVREYLAKSDGDYWFQRAKQGRIVLLDDPKDFEAMAIEIKRAREAGTTLVVSIDPTQWTHKRTRSQFWALLQSPLIKRFELRTAYRQGGAVGRPTLELLSEFYQGASMFSSSENVSDDRNKAKEWEDLCLREARHVDDKGFFLVHEAESPSELEGLIRKELNEVMSFETYRKWPKLLIGAEDKTKLPKGVAAPIREAQTNLGLTVKICSFEEVDKIRGAEFESVFVFLSSWQFSRLKEGPTGLGGIDYQNLTQPLTFFTRAENRLVVIVLEGSFPHASFK